MIPCVILEETIPWCGGYIEVTGQTDVSVVFCWGDLGQLTFLL